VACDDKELLAKEGVLGEELLPGACQVREEPAERAGGCAAGGRESSLDEPPTDAANEAEEVTHILAERRRHGSSKP
jgi:hypothetical protein